MNPKTLRPIPFNPKHVRGNRTTGVAVNEMQGGMLHELVWYHRLFAWVEWFRRGWQTVQFLVEDLQYCEILIPSRALLFTVVNRTLTFSP